MRWVSAEEDISWLEFQLKEPVAITAMQVTSGYMLNSFHPHDKDYRSGGGDLADPIEDYQLEVWHEGSWKPIAGAGVTANTQPQRESLFTPTEGEKFRLLVTKSPHRKAMIYEVEFFEVPEDK
jgi:hypothetical protein